MMRQPPMNCLTDAIASWWVPMWTAMVVDKNVLEAQNNEIRLSLVQQDLSACKERLDFQESEITRKIEDLSREAYRRKTRNDVQGAKRILMKRRSMGVQLNRLQGTMLLIDTHMSTIEGAELDRSILDTLRASGDALKKMGVESGLANAEEIVADVQNQIEAANEMTKVIASGSVSGTMNLFGADFMDDDELQKELDELLDEDSSDTAFMQRIKDLGVPDGEPILSNSTQSQKDSYAIPQSQRDSYAIPVAQNKMGSAKASDGTRDSVDVEENTLSDAETFMGVV